MIGMLKGIVEAVGAEEHHLKVLGEQAEGRRLAVRGALDLAP